MAIDCLHDTTLFLGLPLSVTTSGHLILQITKYALMLNKKDKPINMILSADSSPMSKDGKAEKLHRQFSYAPAECIIKAIGGVGVIFASEAYFKVLNPTE